MITKNVKDYSLVYGNPAKQHGWVSESGNKLDKDFFVNSKINPTYF